MGLNFYRRNVTGPIELNLPVEKAHFAAAHGGSDLLELTQHATLLLLTYPLVRLFGGGLFLFHELAGRLIPLRPGVFALAQGLQLRALSHCTLAGIVSGRFVDSHR